MQVEYPVDMEATFFNDTLWEGMHLPYWLTEGNLTTACRIAEGLAVAWKEFQERIFSE